MLKFIEWLKNIFSSFFKKVLKPAIEIANIVKNLVENPTMDIATAFIPGKYDEIVLDWLRTAMPKILDKLKLMVDVEACLAKTDPMEIIQCLKDIVSKLPENLRGDAYRWIAVEIAKASEMAEKRGSEINLAIESAYHRLENQLEDNDSD